MPEKDVFVNLSLPLDFNVSPNFEVHDLAVDDKGVIWLASTNGLLNALIPQIYSTFVITLSC